MSGLFVLPEDEPYQAALDELRKIPKYPFDEAKDLAFLRELAEEFPEIDLAKEIRAWRAWLLDNDLKGKVNWRARFRRWCGNARAFARRRPAGQSRRGAREATRPGSASEHGKTRVVDF